MDKLGRGNIPEKAAEEQHPPLKPGWLIAEHPPCTIPARTPTEPSSHHGPPFAFDFTPHGQAMRFVRRGHGSSCVILTIPRPQAALGSMARGMR